MNNKLTTWEFFGLRILYSIPLIGFIFLIIHALSSDNEVKRNHARSYFCGLVISIIIGICALFGGLEVVLNLIKGLFN